MMSRWKFGAMFACGLLLLGIIVNQADSKPLRTAVNTAVQIPQSDRLTAVPIATELEKPVGVVLAEEGDGRLFIIEKPGRIRILQPDGTLLPEPFLAIEDRVISNTLEQGLLGLAFSPDYASDGLFYVNYTNLDGDTVVARFAVDPMQPNQALPGSEERVLFIDQPHEWHNGGGLLFGPNDGYLYIGVGDGGFVGDPNNYAQNTTDLLGSILRIDVNPQTTPAPDCDVTGLYGIPADNPLVDGTGGSCDEIWVYGLRNPWTFTIDPATNDLFIGDVGQFEYEEINHVPGGAGGLNFGWRCYEGNHPYNLDGCGEPASYEFPVYDYAHAAGGCSVVSGRVYHGRTMPDLQGVYLFSDFCHGMIQSLRLGTNQEWQVETLLTMTEYLTNFGTDETGELLVMGYSSGIVYRLEPAPHTRNFLPILLRP